MPEASIVHTVGHSTRPIEEFVDVLHAYGIETLVDIRTVPGSRRNPQFGQGALRQSLEQAGIEYRYLKGLGGLRRTSKDSVNTGWRNESFRGYADYMQTDDFERSLAELIDAASRRRVAIMCAEAVPWRCHRSLVGDALLIRGIDVLDIMSVTSSRPHKLTSFAKVEGRKLTYPPPLVAEPASR